MDTIAAIKSRTSIRKYKPEAIPRETLMEIVDCGRMAPTGYNDQPWVFVVVTDPRTRGRIAENTKYGKFIADAGACIAVFGDKKGRTMLEDACAATENMIIASQSLSLGSCWVNSHKTEHSEFVESLLKCPEDHELVTLLAIGVPNEERKTVKKELSKVLRWNSFS